MVFIFTLRIVIGSIFIISGFTKMLRMTTFITTVYKFNVLPQVLIIPFASLLPPIELVLGIALALGYLTRFSSFMIMVILLLFVTAVIPQLLGGPPIGDCGCFGGLMDSAVNMNLLIRGCILFTAAYLVFFQKRHMFALDNKLDPVNTRTNIKKQNERNIRRKKNENF